MSDKKRTAVILIGHGSRVPGAGKDMEKVALFLASSGEYSVVEACYMSRVSPFFPETLKSVAKYNVKKIIVLPYFLHSGLHLVLDIPAMIQKEAEKYPDVKIVYGPHLGYDSTMVELVKQRIEDAKNFKDVRELKLCARNEYPLAEGEMEFVPMEPADAQKYMEKHGGDHHHHH